MCVCHVRTGMLAWVSDRVRVHVCFSLANFLLNFFLRVCVLRGYLYFVCEVLCICHVISCVCRARSSEVFGGYRLRWARMEHSFLLLHCFSTTFSLSKLLSWHLTREAAWKSECVLSVPLENTRNQFSLRTGRMLSRFIIDGLGVYLSCHFDKRQVEN